jgi:hypothetical protein
MDAVQNRESANSRYAKLVVLGNFDITVVQNPSFLRHLALFIPYHGKLMGTCVAKGDNLDVCCMYFSVDDVDFPTALTVRSYTSTSTLVWLCFAFPCNERMKLTAPLETPKCL